jgi:hypothetical protein
MKKEQNMTKKIITIIFLILLTACAPTTASDPVAGQNDVSATATTGATDTNIEPEPTVVPATDPIPTEIPPTSEPEIMDTTDITSTMPVTSTTPVTETTDIAQGQSETNDNILPARNGYITFHQTGGFAGLDNLWTLQADGTLLDKNGNLNRTVDEGTMDMIWAYINSGEFFTYEDNYVPKNSCCDFFFYDIVINDGNRDMKVSTMDTAPHPEALQQFIQTLNTTIGIIRPSE